MTVIDDAVLDRALRFLTYPAKRRNELACAAVGASDDGEWLGEVVWKFALDSNLVTLVPGWGDCDMIATVVHPDGTRVRCHYELTAAGREFLARRDRSAN